MRLSRAWKQTILPIGGAPAADSTHLVAGPPVFSSRILVQGENEISLIVVYGLYLAATIVLTWPVAARIGAHIPGWPGDPQMFVWNMWWLRFSIFDLGRSPLWCSWVAWPFGECFAFHTHTILHGITAAVLSLAGISLAASVSLIFLNSFALTGLGAYLWCREYGASRRGAFVGGFAVAFCVFRLARGLCHYNLLGTEFLPFFWLALKRGFESRQTRPFLWAAVFLVLLFWQDVQMFLFAILFGFCYLLAAAIAKPGLADIRPIWRSVAAAACVFIAGTLPYWVAVLPLLLRGEYAVREGVSPIGADIVSFFIPWRWHWLFGRWTVKFCDRFQLHQIETAYIGYVTLVVAVLGARNLLSRKHGALWLLIAAVVFLVLTFGEQVSILNRTSFGILGKKYSIILPAKFLDALPGLRQFRVPSRFIFLAVFALAAPVAFGSDWLEQRMRKAWAKRLIVPALLLLIAADVAHLPYSTMPYLFRPWAPFWLLKIIRNDPELATVYMIPPAIYYPNEEYCQIFHQKPIYGGSLARRPAWLVTHYYQVPVLGNLFHERMRFFDAAEADKQLTREFVQRFVAVHNIKYLILTSIPPPFGDKYKLLRSLIESRFPITKQWEEKKFVLYELSRPPADQPLTVDLEQPWGMLYLKRGFGTTGEMGCWATRAEAEMVLPLRGKARKTLRVEMSPFVYPWAPPQTVELTLNGHLLGRATLRPGFAMYEFAIPASALDGSPVSALRFSFGYCVSPAEKGVSEDRRTLAAAVRTVEVVTAKD